MNRIKVTDEEIISVSKKAKSASEASKILGIKYDTYKRHAERLGVFLKNQSGKGTNKKSGTKIPLEDILAGKYPNYQTNKLKIRLFAEGLKEKICEICLLESWNGMPIPLELDHIDGNKKNHLYSNLRILCPNCHAQTDTYRGKNKNKIF